MTQTILSPIGVNLLGRNTTIIIIFITHIIRKITKVSTLAKRSKVHETNPAKFWPTKNITQDLASILDEKPRLPCKILIGKNVYKVHT